MDWLVPDCYRKLTPNRYWSEYKPEMIQSIEAVVYHYTASIGTGGTLSWLTDPTSKASAHFLSARDGTRYQLAPLSDRTWHAGGNTSSLFGKQNVNGRTIGIEIMNVGPLYEKDGKIYTIAENKEFNGPGMSGGPPKYQYELWEAYAPLQIDDVIALTKQLVKEFPALATDPDRFLVGHEDVDPSRKIDPAIAFPWQLIRDSIRT